MYIETEGIILRQVKINGGRRMISIFTKNYGKISTGTSITENGKNKTALALRPFTYGRYELFKGRDYYNLQAAETIKSFYGFGEDIDKYMSACRALELTDKLLLEDEPSVKLFALLLDYLTVLENRKKAFDTLLIGYELKLLDLQGLKPSEGLKLKAEIDIINIFKFIETHKLTDLENLALEPDKEQSIKSLLKEYFTVHLGIDNLKSEALII